MLRYVRRAILRIKRPLGRRWPIVALWTLGILREFLNPLPLRVAFSVIVITGARGFLGRGLAKAFEPIALECLRKNPNYRFSNAFSRLLPGSEYTALYKIGAFQELNEIAAVSGRHLWSPRAAVELALAKFEAGDLQDAAATAKIGFTLPMQAEEPSIAHFKGLLSLATGNPTEAVPSLDMATRGLPVLLSPHHNIAARYAVPYKPTKLDFQCGPDGRLYDAANFIGQRLTHVGRGELGADVYKVALDAQARLRDEPEPALSSATRAYLSAHRKTWRDYRILPQEWFTQIGHLGMLDILFRMRELGWWQGEALMLAEPKLIANSAFFKLFEQFGPVLIRGANVDEQVYDELFSLQRWAGLSFNAFRLPQGTVVPWQDAGALLMQQWRAEGRRAPLRDEYDRLFGSDPQLATTMANLKKAWGMKEDDWFVCIHMRDAGHYGEFPGMGQTHRNANVENYLEAIKYITDRGGWVIKLGGRKSVKLPKLPRVFDYARSRYCTNITDIHLIRNAKFFIGTTSGLTNVAISFGIPCALVNCITTDAQLWNDRVRFTLKRLRLANGQLVSRGDMTSTPWRWRVFNAELIARAGATVEENSSAEILETVKEVEALADGTSGAYQDRFPDYDRVISSWRESLDFPHFYGDASPAIASLTWDEDFRAPK